MLSNVREGGRERERQSREVTVQHSSKDEGRKTDEEKEDGTDGKREMSERPQ